MFSSLTTLFWHFWMSIRSTCLTTSLLHLRWSKRVLQMGPHLKNLEKKQTQTEILSLNQENLIFCQALKKTWCSFFLTYVLFFFIPRLLISLYSSHHDTIQFIPNQPQKQRTFHSHHSSSKCSSVQVSTSNLYIQHCLPLISALELIHYFS